MLKSLRSLIPFVLTSLGFTLIALILNMPLFEWQISDIDTDLPSEVFISASWTTKIGDSLESGSYNANDGSYIFSQVIYQNNGNSCSPETLTFVVRRSRSDERLERIALNFNHRIVQWLTGLSQTGQLTMAILLLLCGIYIWWFISQYNRPITEGFILTIVAAILLGFLINVWRLLVPEIGVFVCHPELYGTVTLNAKLSMVHYETLLVFIVAIVVVVGAIAVMLRQLRKVASERKKDESTENLAG